ncbi:hypothetical protein DL768_010371 [Monosporascus sp. mg162]|nr:hypothetical protein DL768_010371 [Monosporascus sp. mg162]
MIYTKEQETIPGIKFNATTSAEVIIEAGESYYGITASVESSNEVSFKYSSSTTTKDSLEIKGTSVIKKRPIDYTINNKSEVLKEAPNAYNAGY